MVVIALDSGDGARRGVNKLIGVTLGNEKGDLID